MFGRKGRTGEKCTGIAFIEQAANTLATCGHLEREHSDQRLVSPGGFRRKGLGKCADALFRFVTIA
jgi:hypothetical protein